MYQILSYIKFILSSTNQHGVHSPFVYNFVTKCLYNRTKYDAYKALYTYRKKLKKSKTKIEVIDLGEGSKLLKTNQRRVSKMIRNSSSSFKNAKLLFKTTKYFNFKTILELGTSLGMGTYAMAIADTSSKIISIEGCPNTLGFTNSYLRQYNLKHLSFINGDFQSTIQKLNEDKFDCVFIDGHHNKKSTINYFESLLSKTHNNTVFVFDDIYWSKGMTEAWAYIKAHPSVSVTVDTFHLGYVFFRKEQAKEHFKIRV
ncbi:MAG: class I SAM-dependent methyltransferase [Winogradskyella sp.]|uniref:O-methyltransferase n=1 Tax=Winogradskyella sp. TaxID=1883156 RepID=UPI0017B21F57|nr:class I SAM-dependent methyltransferase [Winogradskyella sp.]